jgi:hypothetical protein
MNIERAERRFWNRVRLGAPHECWPWGGCKDSAGYGQVHTGGRQQKAHRVAWQLERGEPPPAKIYHSCNNRLCCNPAHLVTEGNLNPETRNCTERIVRGEDHWNSRCSEAAVVQMRHEAAAGATRKELSAKYGIALGTVGLIVTGTLWKSVGGPTLQSNRQAGAAHWKSRLTEDSVREIRKLCAGGMAQCRVAERFGISQGAVSAIKTHKVWTHVV